MSKIILKNINIQELVNNNTNLLTIKELLNKVNYNTDNLYIDRFWNSIKDDKWIYLDNELILWLGYKDIKHGKEQIIKLFKKYNKENEDYKILNNNEFDIKNFCAGQYMEQNKKEEKRGAHNKQYITISTDCFKELCMYIGTSKSKEIKKYYIELEKVFKFYLEYQNEYRKSELENKQKELENKQKELEETKDKVMDMARNFKHKELEFNDFIYIATNNSYHKQNVYKIGKSNRLNKREKCFNTFFINGQKMYYIYIFQCHNARILEQLLFTCLSNYKYNKVNELFNIHLSKLYKMVFDIGCRYNSIINFSNKELFDSNIDKILLNEIPSSQTYPINYNNINLDTYDELLLKKYVNNKNISNIILKDFKDFDFEDQILVNNKALSFDPKTKSYYFTYYNKMIYVCTNCGCFKKDKRSYEQHIRKRNKCMTVQLNLNTIEDIEIELNKQNIKLYSCNKCSETLFKTYDHYKRHIEQNCKNT
jgi:phage anti-repressor protein